MAVTGILIRKWLLGGNMYKEKEALHMSFVLQGCSLAKKQEIAL
jgi:hypothetical protein